MTPSPAPITDLSEFTASVWGVAASLLLLVGLGVMFVWALLRAARFTPTVALVVSLSLLSFLAIAGYIGSGRSELATLGATGIGALAGAVSAQFVGDKDKKEGGE